MFLRCLDYLNLKKNNIFFHLFIRLYVSFENIKGRNKYLQTDHHILVSISRSSSSLKPSLLKVGTASPSYAMKVIPTWPWVCFAATNYFLLCISKAYRVYHIYIYFLLSV